MDLELIRKLSEGRAGGLRKIASDIGMSEANLHRCINNNKIQAGDLERIARLLNVKVGAFFGEETACKSACAQGAHSIAAVDSKVGASEVFVERVRFLERILDEKERTIQILLKSVPPQSPANLQ